ncbi:KAP family P-loop NTPase fold protein [Azospirillum agricola]|uniref:KAP family P-loop NTPase fold protein n=1 Tax=Azospirillum agricola TaxID=1720247 RepID=UPI000A0EF4B8|nr:KAP family NTPase [Azospirillum agricola]SMH28446.1 KAP family P-loop domain-containing protein [Azospirillum lipoferum]
MSDRQDPPAEVTPDHRPDRPIATAGDDRLGRDGFVARLARALVRDGRASGVVVGLTGPWGSGKSSILNLLEGEIKKTHPGAVVVRFDPWLVSGRDDVITQFFAELLATIKKVGTTSPQTGKVAAQLTGRLTKYAANLAPGTALLGLPIPGLREALKAVGEALDRTESLADQHKDLKTCLEGVEVPIVVLIDELDRVEDAEVRAVAQLVRAVADFPGISYLLAYDRDRVVEALGAGATTGREARGNAYLEKIVQLELPLPVTLPDEISELLAAELDAVAPAGLLPVGWRDDPRLGRVLASAIGTLVATPRDVRRVCGMYAALAPMVAGEVDPVDLLGFIILRAKAPEVIEAIRRQPALVVQDPPFHLREGANWQEGLKGGRANPGERMLRLGVDAASPAAPLLGVLFPRLNPGEVRGDREPPDGLRRYGALMTLLRLGLLPGAISRQDVVAFLSRADDAMLEHVRTAAAERRLWTLLDRLANVYDDVGDRDPERTLRVLGAMPRVVVSVASVDSGTGSGTVTALCRWFDQFAEIVCRRGDGARLEMVRSALSTLIGAGEFDAPSWLLRHHFFAHGLFGRPAREPSGWLPAAIVRELAHGLGAAVVAAHTGDRLLASVESAEPLLLAHEVEAWGAEHREAMTRQIQHDDAALVRFVRAFYGEGSVEEDVLERFVDTAILRWRFNTVDAQAPAWSESRTQRARLRAAQRLGAA